MLSSALAAVVVLFIVNELRIRSGGTIRVSPNQAVNLMNHEDATIIDVRGREAYKDGHIVDSVNIAYADLDSKLNTIKNKDKPIILVCEQGMQSPKGVSKLKEQGFNTVFFMQGGISSWKAENLPLTKKD